MFVSGLHLFVCLSVCIIMSVFCQRQSVVISSKYRNVGTLTDKYADKVVIFLSVCLSVYLSVKSTYIFMIYYNRLSLCFCLLSDCLVILSSCFMSWS